MLSLRENPCSCAVVAFAVVVSPACRDGNRETGGTVASAPSASGVTAGPPLAATASAREAPPCCTSLESCLAALEALRPKLTLQDRICPEQKLANMGAPAVRPLIARLESDDYKLRDRAARTLGMIGPVAHEAVPALIALVKRGPPAGAAFALSKIKDPRGIEPVLAKLEQIDATSVAAEYGAAIVPPLVAIVVNPKASMNKVQIAVEALEAVKHPPANAVTPLVGALARGHGAPRPRLATHPPCELPLQAAVARDEAVMTRWSAVLDVLLAFGSGASPALPYLHRLVNDADARTRFRARTIIVNATGPDSPEAVRFRVDELTGTDWLDGKRGAKGKAKAVAALAMIARGERHPCDEQWDRLGDEAKLERRRHAVWALGRISSPDVIPSLTDALASPDFALVRAAAESLGRKGSEAKPAIAELERVARTHYSPEVAAAAAVAVHAIDGRTLSVAPVPEAAAYDPNDTLWEVSVGSSRLPIGVRSIKVPTERLRECERMKIDCDGRRGKTRRVGHDYLALIDQGEWGSFVIVFSRIDETRLWSESQDLFDILNLGGHHLVLTKSGRIVRINPPPPRGVWSAELAASLPGEPLAWEVTVAALIIVVGEDPWYPPAAAGFTSDDARSGKSPGTPQRVTAYTVDADGKVTRVGVKRTARKK